MINKPFLYAIATLVGTIVGVGIFGIPYAVARSGFLIGMIWFIVLGIVTILIHLAYGEVILRTYGTHRQIGYVEKYLGRRAKKINPFIILFSRYGALLAYIIIAGQFLFIIFEGTFGISAFFWSVIFFVFGSLFIFFGLKLIAKGEVFMTALLIVVIGILLGRGFGSIDPGNLISLDVSSAFLPYGIMLFAMGGAIAIPGMREILKGEERLLKEAIILGTLIPIIIFILFTFLVVGVTGSETSEEAIKGLSIFLKDGMVKFGAFFGFLAVATSFLILGLNLKKTFLYEYKFPHFLAWVLTCFIPFSFFLIGLRNFIEVIGFVGSIFGGLEGIILILLFQSAKKEGKRRPEYSLNLPNFIKYGIILMFAFGIVYRIVYFLR